MHPLHRLLSRNGDSIDQLGAADWINPPSPECLSSGAPFLDDTTLWFQDYTAWRRFSQAGHVGKFGAFPDTPHAPGQSVLFLPREKARLDMMLHCLASRMDEQANLWLLGEKRAGIGSAGKRLSRHFRDVDKIDSAGHGALWRAQGALPTRPFIPREYTTTWQLERPEGTVEIHSWPGVFAHGSLDGGTGLLLDHLPEVADGASVLDYGGGAGVVLISLLLRNDTLKGHLLDNNALACLSSRQSLEANNMDAEVFPSDGFSDVSQRFDLIISNPPFHEGQRQNLDLAAKFVQQSGNFLNPGGQLLMVVNRHLPYPGWLDTCFGSHRELARNHRYRILQAQESSLQSPNQIHRRKP